MSPRCHSPSVQNTRYVVTSGARQKNEEWDPEENGGFAVHGKPKGPCGLEDSVVTPSSQIRIRTKAPSTLLLPLRSRPRRRTMSIKFKYLVSKPFRRFLITMAPILIRCPSKRGNDFAQKRRSSRRSKRWTRNSRVYMGYRSPCRCLRRTR